MLAGLYEFFKSRPSSLVLGCIAKQENQNRKDQQRFQKGYLDGLCHLRIRKDRRFSFLHVIRGTDFPYRGSISSGFFILLFETVTFLTKSL